MLDFATARKNMVDGVVHTAGINDPALLEAFRNVPRETFVPAELQAIAYMDEDLSLGGGRFLPEPIPHARMVQALGVSSEDNVLDIGGATGYTASIMSSLARTVTAVEDGAYLEYAQQVWTHLGFQNIKPANARLTAGYVQNAPYHAIFINGAVSEIPQQLLEQLAPGGRLVAIIKQPGAVMGQATLVRNSVGNKFSSRVLFEAGGHYLPGFEPQPVFSFNN